MNFNTQYIIIYVEGMSYSVIKICHIWLYFNNGWLSSPKGTRDRSLFMPEGGSGKESVRGVIKNFSPKRGGVRLNILA